MACRAGAEGSAALSAGIAVLLTLGCGSDGEKNKQASERETQAGKARDVDIEPTQVGGLEPAGLKDHMKAHFAAIRAIQRAIVQGDLAAAKKSARELANHPSHPATQGWEPELKQVRTLAMEIANSTGFDAAAATTGRLAAACAQCHQVMSAIVSFEWQEPPAEPQLSDKTQSRKLQMQQHLWASERLWEGIVGPSDNLWSKGIELMAASTIEPQDRDGEVGRASRAKLAALNQEARGATTLDTRADVYGKMLATCAQCHGAVRDAPAQPPAQSE